MSHVYLAPYVGIGTEADPFRPRGSEQPGWAAIDLRADSTVAIGRALMTVPVRDDTIGAYLGNAPDDVSAVIKTAVQSRFGLTLSGTRLRDIIPELLLEHAREDGTRWRPLRMMRDGMFRVYLGGFFWQARALRGGSTITESSNTTDSDTLGPDLPWTEVLGDIDIVSNRMRGVGTGNNFARAGSVLATDDHYAQVHAREVLSTPNVGPCVRFSPSAETSYVLICRTAATPHFRIFKDVAGTLTSLASSTTDDFTSGDVATLIFDGSSGTGFRNLLSRVTVTDTTIVGNVRGGIYVQNSGPGVATSEVHAFRAGDLSDIRTLNVASNKTPDGAHAASITVTIPATTAGTDLVVMTHAGDDPAAVPEVSTVAATGATFVKQGGVLNSTGTRSVRAECWIARNVPASITSITVTWPSAIVGVVTVAEYSNVQSIGNVATATGAGAHPSISVTTQDTNNFVVAGFANEATAQTAFSAASRGTFWTQQYGLGDGNPDVPGCLVDNAFPTAGALACTLLYPSAVMWAAVAVELRTIGGYSAIERTPMRGAERGILIGSGRH